MISIPPNAQCIVPGCDDTPSLSLSIRLRRRDTSAVWAPECHAYVCDKHGIHGADMELNYRPRGDGEISTSVLGHIPRREPAERTTKVKR